MIDYDILISGISVKNYASNIEVETTIGEELSRSSFRLKKSVKDILNIELQQMVEIYLSGGIVFRGYIDVITEKKAYYEVRCLDVLSSASKKVINRVFLDTEPHGGKISEIFKLLCDEAGLNYDDTTIQDTGDVLKIKKFVCRNASIFERMKKLADAVGYQFYYNPINDKVYFEPFGAREDKGTLTVGQDIPIVKWQKDSRDMFNVLNIIGARQLVETTETFSGDGSTKEFVLGEVPESIKVFVNGNLMKGGVENVSTNPDYVVDKSNKKIVFTTAPGNGAEVKVEYSYTIPIPLRIKNEESVATYGKIEKVITLTDVEDLDDAINRATKILGERSKPQLKASSIKVKNFTINPGDKIRIVDSYNGVDKYFIVKSKKQRIPGGFIEITIGDLDWQLAGLQEEMIDRIKKLEELQFENEDIVNSLVQVGEKDLNIKRRGIKIYSSEYGDSFILGDDILSRLGLGKSISKINKIKEYPYWVEHDENGNYKNFVWTKLNLKEGDNFFYVFYGGNEDNQNGDAVFEFFEDFDGNELDLNKWSGSPYSRINVSNSKLYLSSAFSAGVRTKKNFRTFNIKIVSLHYLVPYDSDPTCDEPPSNQAYRGYIGLGSFHGPGALLTNYCASYGSITARINGEDINGSIPGKPYCFCRYQMDLTKDRKGYFSDLNSERFVDIPISENFLSFAIARNNPEYENVEDKCDFVFIAKSDRDNNINITYGDEETGQWIVNGKTYTKRRKIIINSSKEIYDWQISLSYNKFNDTKITITDYFEDDVWDTDLDNIILDDENRIEGNQSLKLYSSLSGERFISLTKPLGDLTQYQNGKITMWIKNNDNIVDSVKIQIGNDSSNYIETTGKVYKKDENEYFLSDNGWLLIVFDLNDGSVNGSIDWNNINYFKVLFNFKAEGSISINYLAIGNNDGISAARLGKRATLPKKIIYNKTYYKYKGIPYWIPNVDPKIIWFKTDLSIGDNVFYVYYDGEVDKSDGDAVFEFFDGFNGEELDLSKWELYNIKEKTNGQDYLVENSSLDLITDNTIIVGKERFGNNIRVLFFTITSDNPGNMENTKFGLYNPTDSKGIFFKISNNGYNFYIDNYNNYHIYSLNGLVEIFVKNNYSAGFLFTSPDYIGTFKQFNQTSSGFFAPYFEKHGSDTNFYIYYFAVAKYDENLNLSYTYGDEEGGEWIINGEKYTKRRRVVINSNKEVKDYQISLNYHNYFLNNKIYIERG